MVAKARWGALVVSLLLAVPAWAQETTDTAQIRRLQEQVEAITRELEELRLGKEVVVQADSSVSGLGPAAAPRPGAGRPQGSTGPPGACRWAVRAIFSPRTSPGAARTTRRPG